MPSSSRIPQAPGGGGLSWSENRWGCAAGHWKSDPKREFGVKKIFRTVGEWEKVPQKDPKNLPKIEILEFCYKLSMRHTL